jgi:hypothetical protein
MIRLPFLLTATLWVPIALAQAKDCKTVETAPGVKTLPAGCADLGRERTAKKQVEPDKANGIIYSRDGTTVRVNGSVRVDTGVTNDKR